MSADPEDCPWWMKLFALIGAAQVFLDIAGWIRELL